MLAFSKMDDSILERIASGDEKAVKDCIDQYSGLIWSLSRRFIKNSEDAEEVVQEIFVNIWKNASTFDSSKASETSFVSMIARRRIIDFLRSKAARIQKLDHSEDSEAQASSDAEKMELNPDVQIVVDAINQLPKERQEVLYLSIQMGMSHSEISDQLDMPLGSVKSHYRRALQKLREMILTEGSRSGQKGSLVG